MAERRIVKARHGIAMIHCPYCGARIVPTPRELRRWRLDAGLNQREMAKSLKISPAHVAYLENGKRSPSGALIERYRKFVQQ